MTAGPRGKNRAPREKHRGDDGSDDSGKSGLTRSTPGQGMAIDAFSQRKVSQDRKTLGFIFKGISVNGLEFQMWTRESSRTEMMYRPSDVNDAGERVLDLLIPAIISHAR